MSDVIVLRDISPVIVDVEGMGAPGPTGPPGDVAKAADRAALAAIAATAGLTRVMIESGREGLFIFSTANHSADITSDPSQGTYVAPASDVTGALGAWVRQFDGEHNAKWFGAKGDGVTNDGPAVAAAIAHLVAQSQPGFGYGSGSPTLFFPYGEYYLGTTTLDITATLILEGASVGQAGGGATVLRWAANTTGIRVQRHNTSGATAATGTGVGGDGSIFRSLFLKGAFTTTEGEYHGFHLRAVATIEDCNIFDFQGDGIYCKATIGGGVGSEGACNLVQVNRVFSQNCRNGIYFEGDDANGGTITSFSAIICRQWGIWDKSFLGNTFVSCHVASNARNSINDGSTLAASMVSQGGNQYTCIVGQEAGASTNAPTGAATDNTWWIYTGAGGVVAATGVPAWGSGITVRAGGGYNINNINSAASLVSCYAEIDQFSQIDQGAQLVGGWFGLGVVKCVGGAISRLVNIVAPQANGMRVRNHWIVDGDLNVAALLTVDGNGVQSKGILKVIPNLGLLLEIGRPSNGVNAIIRPDSTAPGIEIRGPGNATVLGIYDTAVDANQDIYRNLVKVVGTRKTGWAVDTGTAKRTANATYTPGAALTFGAAYVEAEADAVGTRLVAIEDALRDATQTIKALKDDLHGTAGHGLIGT